MKGIAALLWFSAIATMSAGYLKLALEHDRMFT